MSRVCFRLGRCPNRVTVGKENDLDVVTEVCSECRALLNVSESRTRKSKKGIIVCFSLSVLAFLISLFVFKTNTSNEPSNKLSENNLIQPETTIVNFFDELNEKDFISAFKLTKNIRWGSFNDFKEKLAYWRLLEVKSISGKSYYSRFQPDTIINVKYIGSTEETLTQELLDYDYLLKKFYDGWKIIRVLNPKEPGVNCLKKDEVPQTAIETVKDFFKYIDQGLYEKAHELTNNKKWGKKEKFISPETGWGCITQINIYKIKEIENLSEDFKIILAKYYAKDPCNKSEIHEFEFQVKKTDGLWKITKALLPKEN